MKLFTMIGPLFKLFASGLNECSQIMKTENTREKNVHKLCLVTLTGGRPVSSGNSVRVAGSVLLLLLPTTILKYFLPNDLEQNYLNYCCCF